MTTYTWLGPDGDDWSEPFSWSPSGRPPGAQDTALVPAGSTVAVGETISISTLDLSAAALVDVNSGALLELMGASANSGTIAVSDGTVELMQATVAGGVLSTTGVGEVVVPEDAPGSVGNGSTLDGSTAPVANQGQIVVTATAALSLLGSIANSGTVTLLRSDYYDGTDGIVWFGGSLNVASALVTLTGGGQIDGARSGPVLNPPIIMVAPGSTIGAATAGNVLVNVDNTINGGEDIGGGGKLVVTNEAGGLIENQDGVDALSLSNAGTVEGIYYLSPATLINSGVVTNCFSITPGSLTNTGTIIGGQAIGAQLLDSGVVLNNTGGTVEAQGGRLTLRGALDGGDLAIAANSTLELSTDWFASSSAVPLSFSGASDFLQIDVTDTAGSYSAVGDVTISNFDYGDTIAVHGTSLDQPFPGFGTIANDGTTLTFVESGQTLGALSFSGGTARLVQSTDADNNEIITVACFAAGARILTAAGELPVEILCVGDVLSTLIGCRTANVRWLGHRRVADAQVVRIEPNALGAGIPHRVLWLSPDHSVWMDQNLIPVRHLINGASVVQEIVEEVAYYHVELAAHDVILAEGLPCESYLDTGNRAAFVNGGGETVHGEDDVWAVPAMIWRGPSAATCRLGSARPRMHTIDMHYANP